MLQQGPINIRELQLIHERFLVRHADMVETQLEQAGVAAQDHVRTYSKFKRRSSQPNSLKDATETQLIRTASGMLVRVKSTKKYSKSIEYGARPHLIQGKRGKMLAFRGRDGRMVFRRKVKHPGNRAFRFLYNATDAAHRSLGKDLELGMRTVARKF